MSLIQRLYRNEVDFDFIGPRKRWYIASGIVVAICLASLIFRGFHLGIDFKGGAEFDFPSHGQSVSTAQSVVESTGVRVETAQVLGNTGGIRIQTPPLNEDQIKQVSTALQQRFNDTNTQVSVSTVGASWGSSITKKALQGLLVFLIAVIIFISIRFEPKMAAAAIVALLHDLIITAGIYSLVGFEVTPSTVIALLTILGFSLYDTVVVFDKVRENTAGLATAGRRTYAQATNDAVNQTLMRSINTSLIALLPVGALLVIGAGLLGAGTLKDLALAQFIGLASGAYSSIFIAAPLLVDFKEREPAMQQLNARVARAQQAAASRRPAGATERSGGGTATLVREDDDGPGDSAAAGDGDASEDVVTSGALAGRTPPRRQARSNGPRKAAGRGGRGGRSNQKRRR